VRNYLIAVPLVYFLATAAEAQAPTYGTPTANLPGLQTNGTVGTAPTAPTSSLRPGSWPEGKAAGDYAPAGIPGVNMPPEAAVEPSTAQPARQYPETPVGAYPSPTAGRPYPATRPHSPAGTALPHPTANYPSNGLAAPVPHPAGVTHSYQPPPTHPHPQPTQYGPAYGGGVARPPVAAGPPVGGRQAAEPDPPPPAQPAPAEPAPGYEIYEGARILARVGTEVILAADVMSGLQQLIEANKDRMPEDVLREQIDKELKKRLENAIDMKLLWLDAKRTIPEEAYTPLKQRVAEHFETKEIPHLMEQAKVDTRKELDDMLRSMGSSIDKRKRDFIQMAIAREWLRQQSKGKAEVTLDDIRVYYEEHAEEFDHPARAKWEELAVRFSEFPTKAAARQTIAAMGNQVFAGRPLTEVAKAHSQGSTASEGGQRDWTTRGSLACEALDRAIFGLPVGQLSPIIESKRGYHIVRVTEREEAYRTPFTEAQAEIREKLQAEQQKKQGERFLAKLKRETPVWTIYDGDENSSANAGGYPYR